MIAEAERRSIADALAQAEADTSPIDPLTDRWADLDIEGAYAIQRFNIERRVASGARRLGWKVGLTSLAMQRQLGVGEPDFGVLLDDMEIDGGVCDVSSLIAPRVEGELAFRLGRDLAGPTSLEQARAAVEAVVPALEIIDSRILDWKIKLEDTVADNASSCRFLTADAVAPADELRLVGMVLERDGEIAETGAGAAVLGNPLEAVVWLANRLAGFGERLQAGELVLSGAIAASIPAMAGSTVRARFSHGLGEVSARFTGAS